MSSPRMLVTPQTLCWPLHSIYPTKSSMLILDSLHHIVQVAQQESICLQRAYQVVGSTYLIYTLEKKNAKILLYIVLNASLPLGLIE
jgi:hypothetical protein